MSTRIDPVGSRCLHTEQVGLVRLRTWTLANFGGASLGIDSCRKTRNGKGYSVHMEGRAYDWFTGDRAQLDRYFAFLIAHANALNVQAIHDYDRDRRWTGSKGWYAADIGYAPHKHETHVERNWDGARDARPIGDIVGGVATVPTATVPTATVQVPAWYIEEDDEEMIEQPGRTRDPNRPATASLKKAGKQIVLYNGAGIGGDFPADLFGVKVRIRDVSKDIPFPIDGWLQVPGTADTSPKGGVRIVDAFGHGYTYTWS